MNEEARIPEVRTTAIIKVGPEHDSAILVLAQEAKKLRDYAMARVITTETDLKPATEDLSIIARVKKALSEKKAEYLKPIKAHVDAVNTAFTSITAPLDEADTVTRGKILTFRQEQERRVREAEEINRLRVEAAKREATLNGTGEITVETTLLEVPATLPNHVRTELGSLGTAKTWKFEVVDIKMLPDDYKVANEVKIGQVVRATKGTISIPGVKIWSEESIRITTTK